MTVGYSDLEAVPKPEETGLHPVEADKAAYYAAPDKDTYEFHENGTPPKRQRICGLAPKTFWILATILILIVIGAAVGGGVGGSLSRKNNTSDNNKKPVPEGSASSTTGPATTSASGTPTVTTTEVPGPTNTLLRDCPSSNNTIYNAPGSQVMSFRKICSGSITGNGRDSVNEPTKSLNDCINLCADYNRKNATEIKNGQSEICNAVCWRNGFQKDNDWPGQCFGFTTQNSSSNFVVEYGGSGILCDSAGLINQ